MKVPVRFFAFCMKRNFLSTKFLAVFLCVLVILLFSRLSNNHVVKIDSILKSKTTTPRTPAYLNPERLKQIMINKKTNNLMAKKNKAEMKMKWWKEKIERLSKMRSKPEVRHVEVNKTVGVNYNIHIFYYAWYENEAVDGGWQHWNHEYLRNWRKNDKKIYPTGRHVPPDDIGSNFYPKLGCYSSRDPVVVDQHMKLIRDAGIGRLNPSQQNLMSWSKKNRPKIVEKPALHPKIHFCILWQWKGILHQELLSQGDKIYGVKYCNQLDQLKAAIGGKSPELANRRGVLIVSWYPPGMSDGSPRSPDTVFSHLLDAARKYNLKVSPHVEPYEGRNPSNLLNHLKYFTDAYGNHSALYKMKKGNRELIVYYIYDSYRTPAVAWKELLSVNGNLTIRGTPQDGIFLGLMVDMDHRHEIKRAKFDGFYTYFASNGFSYGSSWKNWKSLSLFARLQDLIFIPSIGPGYIDTRVRPWNAASTRHRRHGKYYEVGWRTAIGASASHVSITSFNEWHEGTQIEPAVPKSSKDFLYLDYEPEGPDFYMNLTKFWINEFYKKSAPIL